MGFTKPTNKKENTNKIPKDSMPFLFRFFSVFKDAVIYLFVIVVIAAIVSGVTGILQSVRIIPGPKFIGVFIIYTGVILILIIFLLGFSGRIYAGTMVKKVKDMPFINDDLIILQKFDRNQICGYYILKGLLHRVLLVHQTKDKNMKINYYIQRNKKLSSEKVSEYCNNNPQVKKIIDFLGSEKKQFSDIVKGVYFKMSIKDPCALYVYYGCLTIEYFAEICFWLWLGAVYYLGISKLIMGIILGKPISVLLLMLFFITLFAPKIRIFMLTIAAENSDGVMVKDLISHKSAGLSKMYSSLTPIDVTKMYDAETVSEILLTYVTCQSELLSNQNKSSGQFIPYLFSFIAQEKSRAAAILAAKNMGTSCGGCSGCSSCSGCGGGCGGCGGSSD